MSVKPFAAAAVAGLAAFNPAAAQDMRPANDGTGMDVIASQNKQALQKALSAMQARTADPYALQDVAAMHARLTAEFPSHTGAFDTPSLAQQFMLPKSDYKDPFAAKINPNNPYSPRDTKMQVGVGVQCNDNGCQFGLKR